MPTRSPSACEHGGVATICVFCGANTGCDPEFEAAAIALGASLAAAGHDLVYGGGRVGLMGAVADAALASGGRVIGFMPQALVDREVAHLGLTELVVTDSMHTRKSAMSADVSSMATLARVATSPIVPVAAPDRTYPHSGMGVPALAAVMSTAASPSNDTEPSEASDVVVMRDW